MIDMLSQILNKENNISLNCVLKEYNVSNSLTKVNDFLKTTKFVNIFWRYAKGIILWYAEMEE